MSIRDFLRYLVRPRFWLMRYPYNAAWDAALNHAMDADAPTTHIDAYTAKVGPFCVWVSNWPYAYGRLYRPDLGVRPSRRTIERLRRHVDRAIIAALAKAEGRT